MSTLAGYTEAQAHISLAISQMAYCGRHSY